MARIRALVLDGVRSPHTKRVYGKALDEFFAWHETAGQPGLSKASVQAFRAELERRQLAASTTNVYLSTIRKLAQEAADNSLLAPELAAGVARIAGLRQAGIRAGNWLTPEEASRLLTVPDPSRLKGVRDRAVLALLLGCGLRRAELAGLTIDRIEKRDGRWVLPDLEGKGKRLRTVPVPGWTKTLIDHWIDRAGILQGQLFRPLNKGGRFRGDRLTEDSIWADRSCLRERGTRRISNNQLACPAPAPKFRNGPFTLGRRSMEQNIYTERGQKGEHSSHACLASMGVDCPDQ